MLAVEDVLQIHELHVYSLTARQCIGSFHAIMYDDVDFMTVSDQLKLIMHAFGVHSTTIQPEFVGRPS